MKASIGYTVSLNIIIVFIVIVFAFVIGIVGYYKAYKINNVIVESLEKYEGYNDLSKSEIDSKLSSLGYNQSKINCGNASVDGLESGEHTYKAINDSAKGYCIYYSVNRNKCSNTVQVDAKYPGYCKTDEYMYIVKTYMTFDIPIINKILKIPVYSRTNSIYACYGANC